MKTQKASKTVAAVLTGGERRIEYVPLKDCRRAARNPKAHKLGEIQNSMGRFGYVEPLVMDERTGQLVAGHGRLESLQDLQLKQQPPPDGVTERDGEWLVPVVRGWASKDESEAEGYLLASNQLTTLGGWNTGELADVLRDLAQHNDGLLGTGFDGQDLDRILRGLKEEAPGPKDKDAVPEVADADAYVQPGEVYRLGRHNIMCGSSTEASDIDVLMNGAIARFCFTDPPWNVAYEGKTKKKLTISNDDMGEDFPQFLAHFSLEMARVMEPGAPLYLVMSTSEWPNIDRALRAAGFRWSDTLIWRKDTMVLSRGDYHRQYEPIWYGWKDGAARLKELKDRTQSNVWDVDRPKRSEDHPTTKPVALIERALWNSSNKDDVVLEPFSGSGSTLMACETTGRVCRAMELEPRFVQVAIERWQAYTGKSAERLA